MHSSKKIAVVSGGSRGIGKSLVKLLVSEGYFTIASSTTEKGALAAQKEFKNEQNVEFRVLDLGEKDSIAAFAQYIEKKFKKVDILVNNACTNHMILDPNAELFEKTSFDLSSKILGINYFGTKDLTLQLLPMLAKNGTVLTMSSQGAIMCVQNLFEETKKKYLECKEFKELDQLLEEYLSFIEDGSWKRKGFDTRYPLPSYGISKFGLNIFTKILSEKNTDIFTVCCHPGHVKTRLTVKSKREKITPDEAAKIVFNYTKEETRNEFTGKFVMNGKVMGSFEKIEVPSFGKK